MAWLFFVLGLMALSLAGWLAWRARQGQRRSGMPQGRLVYADTGRWSAVAQPYYSPRFRLAGKPDYLVEDRGRLIPVEVKHTAAPAGSLAYDSHIMQLAAYCLLVEEAHEHAPAYGLIRYNDATVRIDYTPALRRQLLDLIDNLRADRKEDDVGRSHQDSARCRACGVRHACGQHALD